MAVLTPAQRLAQRLQRVGVWTAYFRANPQRYVSEVLFPPGSGLRLKWFQKFLLYAMCLNDHFMYVAARGQGKTMLVAIFACVRAILYPGTKIIIFGGVRDQALNLLRKVELELLPNSPTLAAEIDFIRTTPADPKCIGSNIVCDTQTPTHVVLQHTGALT
jgi:hypothetical protein